MFWFGFLGLAFSLNQFLNFIQGWKWSSARLLPVGVLGAVRWPARDFQVSKPVVRAALCFLLVKHLERFAENESRF